MSKDSLKIMNMIIDMWHNDLELGNGSSSFEDWCKDNIDNQEQAMLVYKVKNHVDEITFILESED